MQGLIEFVVGHQAIVAAVVVGVLDLAFALVPSVASNGILHMAYLFLKKIAAGSNAPKA